MADTYMPTTPPARHRLKKHAPTSSPRRQQMVRRAAAGYSAAADEPFSDLTLSVLLPPPPPLLLPPPRPSSAEDAVDAKETSGSRSAYSLLPLLPLAAGLWASGRNRGSGGGELLLLEFDMFARWWYNNVYRGGPTGRYRYVLEREDTRVLRRTSEHWRALFFFFERALSS
jgi:hypothetical protein